MHSQKDRVNGVLFGLAAGDRIGGPIRMALRVAESLIDLDAFDSSDIASRYLKWWQEGGFDTGPTVARVLSLIETGVQLNYAMIQTDSEMQGMTAGCNPAHRSAPLAMCSAIEDSRLIEAAITEASLTHRHPLAGDVAAAVVCLCRALIRGNEWSVSLGFASAGRNPEVCDAFTIKYPESLSQSGFAPKVLEAAIYFVHTSTSFSTALTRSIDFAGPENYCPVLVGSIAGARWGGSQIEDKLISHHHDLVPRVIASARALAKEW